MIPASVREFHGSHGEERVFQALRGLPDEVTVMQSFRWLHPGSGRGVTGSFGPQGEGDFVLFDPGRGLMVIKVKGGHIWCNQGEWRQKNRRTDAVFTIHPEEQARNTGHRIREEVQARVAEARSLLFCHAIWFPDGVTDRVNLPMYCPGDIVLDEDDIARPALGIAKAFAYWHKVLSGRGSVQEKAARAVMDAMAPTLSLVPSVRRGVEEREAQLVQLTHEQANTSGRWL